MAAFRHAVVDSILEERPDLIRMRLRSDQGEFEGAAFPGHIPPLHVGDRVIANTTGIDLGLGTGGVAFVLWNLDAPDEVEPGEGHIVKLRYTPWQTEVLAAEAPESPHHEVLAEATSLDGMPVVVCSLHSQIAGVAAGLKAASPDARVAYVMTDGGALPLAWSRLVTSLRSEGLVELTCTSGHAFGGDLEAVNVYSALLAVRLAGGADAAIVSMGPGVVGTATRFGHTSVEQGQVLDAVAALSGIGVATLRLSFSEARSRHRGVSHHTITALSFAARERCRIAVPILAPAERDVVDRDLREAGLADKHELVTVSGEEGLALMARSGIRPSSMGVPFEEARELFAAACAAGAVAAGFTGGPGR